jgi:type II secretory ATPase GspE/PulE/Tfp pilus assembly ATPase PilB-like protein
MALRKAKSKRAKAKAVAKAKKDEAELPLHELLPQVTFSAMGAAGGQQDQGNLLAARQSPVFPETGGLIAQALSKRGDRLMLNYAQAGVGVKADVDGVWLNLDPRDRQLGDGMLIVLKKLAGLNVKERRARQDGRFGAEFQGMKFFCEFTSQGIKTGERVVIKFIPKKPKFKTIEDLGMRPAMRSEFKSLIDEDEGFVVFSTPPGNGLTTLWNVGLDTSDRYVRDFVSLEDETCPEEEVINVGPIFYDGGQGQTPADILPKLLLKQPDVFVVPNLADAKTIAMLCEQVNKQHKMVISRVPAKESVEVLLRVLMLKAPVDEFAKAVTMVLNGRLIRKLCDECKQAYQPAPQLLQKLGIPPGRVSMLYREYQPPPPEEQVDEKGRPLEIPVCKQCGGVGYFGRTSIFELLKVNDKLREVLRTQPKLEVLRKVARTAGLRTLQEEGVLLVAQGITSLPELQRVLKA